MFFTCILGLQTFHLLLHARQRGVDHILVDTVVLHLRMNSRNHLRKQQKDP